MKIEVKKILSIVLLSLVYILVTTFVQYRYKNSFDIGEGILYFYSNTLYTLGFIITFLIYGTPMIRKWISSFIGVVFIVWYLCIWIDCINYMPYEAPFYIVFGFLIFITEMIFLCFLYKKNSVKKGHQWMNIMIVIHIDIYILSSWAR